ncbi:glycosyltransferase family 39 protein [Actinoplanes siamensis]|uniref:Membrane protein n=1 Tax=Actinoplanes siamensis TaxID=1223317 RepID=A0A919TPI3_9ACTN|nr:glycosyltransferase family 39 protein [Actinoplanes siamensis]GIF09173.1 membrane protein [Actinoplanes siamensis]
MLVRVIAPPVSPLPPAPLPGPPPAARIPAPVAAAAPVRPRFGPAIAILLYAVLRATGVAAAWWFASGPGIPAGQRRGLLRMLSAYDANWYVGIVRYGYDTAIPLKLDGGLATTNLAFFPLFPALIAALDPLLPGGPEVAGVAVSWLAGLAAAGGLYAIGAHLRGRGRGILLAALWAVLPHAFIESMGYTETLFTALAAWSLYAVIRRRWLAAGLLCLLAGLTRPTAAALILVVGLSALIAVTRRRDGWRPWAGGVLAPLGLLGHMAWVGDRLGRPDGYFHVQNDAWKMTYDWGQYTVSTIGTLLSESSPPAMYAVTLTLVVAIGLLVVLVTARVPWQLKLFSAVLLAMSFFGHGYYHSKARLLLPAFPLLLPAAAALARARRPVAVAVLATLTVISTGYGIYLGTVWTFSP